MTLTDFQNLLSDAGVGPDDEFDFWVGKDDSGFETEISNIQRFSEGGLYVNLSDNSKNTSE